jgi:hypothetical protein
MAGGEGGRRNASTVAATPVPSALRMPEPENHVSIMRRRIAHR